MLLRSANNCTCTCMRIHTLSVLRNTHISIQYILVLNTVSEQQSAELDTVSLSLVSMLRRTILRLSLSHQYSHFLLVWSRDSPDTLEVVSFSRTFRSVPSREDCSIVILPLSIHIMVLKYMYIFKSFSTLLQNTCTCLCLILKESHLQPLLRIFLGIKYMGDHRIFWSYYERL